MMKFDDMEAIPRNQESCCSLSWSSASTTKSQEGYLDGPAGTLGDRVAQTIELSSTDTLPCVLTDSREELHEEPGPEKQDADFEADNQVEEAEERDGNCYSETSGTDCGPNDHQSVHEADAGASMDAPHTGANKTPLANTVSCAPEVAHEQYGNAEEGKPEAEASIHSWSPIYRFSNAFPENTMNSQDDSDPPPTPEEGHSESSASGWGASVLESIQSCATNATDAAIEAVGDWAAKEASSMKRRLSDVFDNAHAASRSWADRQKKHVQEQIVQGVEEARAVAFDTMGLDPKSGDLGTAIASKAGDIAERTCKGILTTMQSTSTHDSEAHILESIDNIQEDSGSMIADAAPKPDACPHPLRRIVDYFVDTGRGIKYAAGFDFGIWGAKAEELSTAAEAEKYLEEP